MMVEKKFTTKGTKVTKNLMIGLDTLISSFRHVFAEEVVQGRTVHGTNGCYLVALTR